MTRNQQISILGCGWLGLPLAKKLIQQGYRINGSTTTEAKVSVLQQEGINAFLIDLFQLDTKQLTKFINKSSVIVVAIPPKSNTSNSTQFIKQLTVFLKHIQPQQKTVLISSTSVYPNTNNWVDEKMEIIPDSARGENMLAIEQTFLKHLNSNLSIVRMGGLIGPNRNPVKFLAGKINILNGEAPVNLIHQTDALELLIQVIEQQYWGEIINGVSSEHPSRKDYYTQAALNLNLSPPLFSTDSQATYKLVSNQKSIEELSIHYKKLH